MCHQLPLECEEVRLLGLTLLGKNAADSLNPVDLNVCYQVITSIMEIIFQIRVIYSALCTYFVRTCPSNSAWNSAWNSAPT